MYMEPWTKLSISISSGIRSRMARISARLSSLADTTRLAPSSHQNR